MTDRRLPSLWLVERQINPEIMILGSHEFGEVLRIVGRKIENKTKVTKFPEASRSPT